MKVTPKHLARFVELTKLASYDYSGDGETTGSLKQEFKNLGRRILKHIAEELKLVPGTYDIRWNPGGIACSGDHTLHTDKFYVALHDNIGSGWFYWRTVGGRRDYTGGPNQIVTWKQLLAPGGLDKLIRDLRIAQEGYKDPQTGDIILNINQALRLAAQA